MPAMRARAGPGRTSRTQELGVGLGVGGAAAGEAARMILVRGRTG